MSIVRASLLGGVDGVISSFAITAGSNAGSLSTRSVLIVGVSSVFADGLSMGVSEFLSHTNGKEVQTSPWILGLSCFASFVSCGAVPVLTYFASEGSLLSTSMFSLVTLMLLGAARSRHAREPILLSIAQTTLLGSAAGAVAYTVGVAVRGGVSDDF